MNPNNLESIVSKQRGSITKYRMAKYIEDKASQEMKNYLRFCINFDAMIKWYEQSDYDPDLTIKWSIRKHIKRHPEEYSAVFESFFSAEEIKDLSKSLMEV